MAATSIEDDVDKEDGVVSIFKCRYHSLGEIEHY
jgi:hypothetical protein